MRLTLRALRKKVTLISTVFMLVVGTTAVALPFLLSEGASAIGETVVTPASMHGWSGVTTTGGTVDFVVDSTAPLGVGAAKLVTSSDNDSRARLTTAQFSNTLLSSVTEASYRSKVVSASNEAGSVSYSIQIDVDGNLATNDVVSLNHEPYWQNGLGDPQPVVQNTWQEWDVFAGKFWARNASLGFMSEAGGPPLYTLSEILAIAPNARVTNVSVYIGSYNPSYVTYVDDVSFNGVAFDFDPYVPAPTPVPTKPSLSGEVIYDSVSATLPSNYPSQGYEATSTSALGDKISFAGTGRHLEQVAVTLSSWACQNGGWNTASCVSTPGATFTHPITLNIYTVADDGSVGTLIASRTQTFAIPYRPTADPTCSEATKWRDTTGTCFNGYNHVVVFDAGGITVPDTVIYSVAYNTQHYGAAPTYTSGAYDSLNVGLNTDAVAPYVGTDVVPGELYWDATYLGRPAGLTTDGGWETYRIAATFTAAIPDTQAPAVPSDLSWVDSNNQAAQNGSTSTQRGTLSWTDATPGDVDHYVYKFWTNIPGYFEGQGNAWTTSDSQYITTASTGGSIWTNFEHEGTYYFCVEAVDGVGNNSGCSNTLAITYDITAPATPTHLSPTDNVSQSSNAFWFDWDDVAGAVSYEVQFSQSSSVDGQGALNVGVWAGDADHAQPTESRAWSAGANGAWYWQVRAVDAVGNKSAWSTPWKVTIDMQAPIAPVLSVAATDGTPLVSGDYTNTYDLVSSWTASSPDTVKYIYKYWNAIPGNYYDLAHAYIVETTATSQPGALNQGEGTHYLQIFAVDAAGNVSAGSNIFEIRYDTTAPDVAINTTNAGTDTTPTVSGTSEPGSVVTLSLDSSAVVIVTSDTNGNWSWTPSSDLTVGAHEVRVAATDAAGNTTVSTQSFAISSLQTTTTTTTNVPTTTTTAAGVAVITTTTDTTDTLGTQDAQTTTDISSVATDDEGNNQVAAAGASDTNDDEQGTGLFSIAWYWWLVIAAAVAGIWWLIAAARRRNEQN